MRTSALEEVERQHMVLLQHMTTLTLCFACLQLSFENYSFRAWCHEVCGGIMVNYKDVKF